MPSAAFFGVSVLAPQSLAAAGVFFPMCLEADVSEPSSGVLRWILRSAPMVWVSLSMLQKAWDQNPVRQVEGKEPEASVYSTSTLAGLELNV